MLGSDRPSGFILPVRGTSTFPRSSSGELCCSSVFSFHSCSQRCHRGAFPLSPTSSPQSPVFRLSPFLPPDCHIDQSPRTTSRTPCTCERHFLFVRSNLRPVQVPQYLSCLLAFRSCSPAGPVRTVIVIGKSIPRRDKYSRRPTEICSFSIFFFRVGSAFLLSSV